MLTSKQVAYAAVKALDDKKGLDIRVLRIEKISSLADYFVLCTGSSNTHVRTLCDSVEYALEQLDEKPLGREGHRGNTWELLDYGIVVVHVFTPEARQFYALERLWGDAQEIPLSDIITDASV